MKSLNVRNKISKCLDWLDETMLKYADQFTTKNKIRIMGLFFVAGIVGMFSKVFGAVVLLTYFIFDDEIDKLLKSFTDKYPKFFNFEKIEKFLDESGMKFMDLLPNIFSAFTFGGLMAIIIFGLNLFFNYGPINLFMLLCFILGLAACVALAIRKKDTAGFIFMFYNIGTFSILNLL